MGDPIAEFEAKMIQKYSSQFGGLFINPNGSFSVVEVGNDPTFQKTAQTLFDQTPAEFGVTVAASMLQLHFSHGTHSLVDLYAIKDKINSAIRSAASGSSMATRNGIFGTGLDPRSGQVVLNSNVSNPTNVNLASIDGKYGSLVRLHISPDATKQSRSVDQAPWKGGDVINSATAQCTLGWGVHVTTTGAHFNLTAGHCGLGNWYQGASYLGNSTIGVSPTTCCSLDTELIPDWSSNQIWQGAFGTNPYLTTITGYANDQVGSYVCREGSSALEECGYITEIDQTGVPQGLSDWQNNDIAGSPSNPMNGINGDSGGPVVWDTIYGPLAAGTIVGGDSGYTGYFEEIDADLYVYSALFGASVVVNTSSAP